MLADKLYELESFKRQYESVLILSVCRTIDNLIWEYSIESLLKNIDWNNIISIASALAYSDKNEHLDASLRIAQTALIEDTTTKLQKDAAAVILISLTNKPAINLAINRNYIQKDFQEHLPFSLKLQNEKISFSSSIIINDKVIELNRFQNEVYKCQELNDSISISAPTSAGKSFILYNLLIEKLISGQKNIIYIVPTRALISQVESDLREEIIKKHNLKTVNITTIPQQNDISNNSNVFIFTQERLHWFLCDNTDIKIDFLIIDEAHKIEDGYRGILLQQKLEEIVAKNDKIKVYFSSPFTSNPEILLENIKNSSTKSKINTQFIAVNQNLIYIRQVPRKVNIWQLSLCLIDKIIDLGKITLTSRPIGEYKKIAFISDTFSNNGVGNIIYSNGAAEAEKIALILSNSLENEKISESLENLIKLVEKTIHKKYRLVSVLSKKIAFHYGNMPLIVREEIERLFKLGEIKYLICTSTLLEGVNLPAKSIFIRKPKRGSGNPMNQNDFWNLAGRAGRWGKEFSGNIICIEPDSWEISPNPNKSKQLIKRAIDIIEKNYEELLRFIENGSLRKDANKRPDLEFAFSYYYIKYIDHYKLSNNDKFEQALQKLFLDLNKTINIPDNIIKRNPGISPFAQQELWNYFSKNLNRIDEMIPVYPEDSNAINEYIKLINRIGKTLADYPKPLAHSRSILLTNWMSGKPLSYLIRKSFESYQKKSKDISLHTVIREVMDNVETFVRFRFAKDSSCYIDILRYFLIVNNREDLLDNIPQFNLWLEFGVSQKTQLSLLSLGLTRNTVIELASYITDADMSKEEVSSWIKEQDLDRFELSPIIIDDIKRKINI